MGQGRLWAEARPWTVEQVGGWAGGRGVPVSLPPQGSSVGRETALPSS